MQPQKQQHSNAPTSTYKRSRLLLAHRYLVMCALGVLCVFGDVSTLSRRLSEKQQELPTMYTFFAEIPDQPMATGMSEKDNTRLLHHWKRLWRQAGWNPVVLSMNDARKHPDFLQVKPWLKQTGAGTYNVYCFLRWLAMAQVGGGWMADYDVFPLHDFRHEGFDLPNDGKLTVHNRLCPSLVSGTAEEWTRVALHLMEYAAEHHIKSDQTALVEVYNEEPTLFLQDWSLTQSVFNATGWTSAQCQRQTPPSMRAVHFAHSPIKKALRDRKLKSGYGVRNRAEVASDFLSQWIQHCGRQKFVRDGRLLEESRGNKMMTMQRLEDPIIISTSSSSHNTPRNPKRAKSWGPKQESRQVLTKRTIPMSKWNKQNVKGSKKKTNPDTSEDSRQKSTRRESVDAVNEKGSKKQSNRLAAKTPKATPQNLDNKNTGETATTKAPITLGKISKARYVQALQAGSTKRKEGLKLLAEPNATSLETMMEPTAMTERPKVQRHEMSTDIQVDIDKLFEMNDMPNTTPREPNMKKYNPARGLLG